MLFLDHYTAGQTSHVLNLSSALEPQTRRGRKICSEGNLEAKRPVFGFGHAVLRAEDPRATAQFALGEEICPDDEYFRIIQSATPNCSNGSIRESKNQ